MLDERLQSTRGWLEVTAPQTLTIQLLGAENPQQLKEHLSTIAKSIEITNIFVNRTTARQKPFLSVLYGSFDTREAERAELVGSKSKKGGKKGKNNQVDGNKEQLALFVSAQ